MWRDSNKTAARPRGHASIVDDGGESAVFHMNGIPRLCSRAGYLARDQLDR